MISFFHTPIQSINKTSNPESNPVSSPHSIWYQPSTSAKIIAILSFLVFLLPPLCLYSLFSQSSRSDSLKMEVQSLQLLPISFRVKPHSPIQSISFHVLLSSIPSSPQWPPCWFLNTPGMPVPQGPSTDFSSAQNAPSPDTCKTDSLISFK